MPFYAQNEPNNELLLHKNDYLHVHSCGVFSDPNDMMIRPKGSSDYLLTYLTKGTMHIDLSETETHIPIKPGTVILYRPREPQRLYMPDQQFHSRYWVHFLGHGVDRLLQDCGFGKRRYFYIGHSQEVQSIFFQMIYEMQMTAFCYNEMCNSLLIRLLAYMARCESGADVVPSSSTTTKLTPAIEHMYLHYAANITTEQYADMCHMSKYHFARSFKEYTGISPSDFLKGIRINNACALLSNTDFKIAEVAKMVGYEDPLYFSRVFKQSTGRSPREYQAIQRLDEKNREG